MAKEDNLSAKEREEVKKEIKKSKIHVFRQEFKQQTGAAIIAAFGFLIALVWKDIIVNTVDTIINRLPSVKYAIISTLISAVIVTTVCVIGIILISRWARKPEDSK